MNILYISKGNGADYLCDGLFHGLRTLCGDGVVDVNYLAHMYRGAQTSHLYGKGFTLYGLLEDLPVDRTDILDKIKRKFWDLVIFGSIHRSQDFLYDVVGSYPKHKIIFVDGEDQPMYLLDFPPYGLYFKREIHNPTSGLLPIQFGIPEEKICGAGVKGRLMAPLDPQNVKTYIYDDEESYYNDYRHALFAKTVKKAGWDCLRHYEIMACECIPYFQNLEYCPPSIMTELPKQDLIMVKNLIEYSRDGGINIFQHEVGRTLWSDVNARVQKVLREKLTTVALAKRVLEQAAVASGVHREMVGA